MKITILGSGTGTPQLARNSSGLYIQSSKVKAIVDMGAGTLRRMCEAKIDYREIDLIALTHFHPDHITDFISFLFASNYAYGLKRTDLINVIGPNGLKQFYESLVQIFGHWVVPSDNRLRITEMSATELDIFEMDGIRIRSAASIHSFPALSYRIEADNVSLSISGDTDFSENLINLARDSNILICECSMPDSMKIQGHMTPSEAGTLGTQASVKQLILTHFYPPCDEVDVLSAARSNFTGPILKAEDLMTIELDANF
jgi:ribonuclease BN (tRNA processing enzyme)